MGWDTHTTIKQGLKSGHTPLTVKTVLIKNIYKTKKVSDDRLQWPACLQDV